VSEARGTGGRRFALPAFFALTAVVAVAFVMNIARKPDADAAETRPRHRRDSRQKLVTRANVSRSW